MRANPAEVEGRGSPDRPTCELLGDAAEVEQEATDKQCTDPVIEVSVVGHLRK